MRNKRPPKALNREEMKLASHRFQNPSTMPPTRGYTHVVETRSPSRTIYIAGQLGMTADGKFAGADFNAQVVQCFENLKHALAAADASFEYVVKVTAFFIDIANIHTYLEVRNRHVNAKAPPASTAIQISKLAHEGALFEIEAIAVVPEN
jgi:enamine deaminase RidA (YjgF/YER057c/UK114 family)